MAPETIEQILDYAYRTSSNAAYVCPTRGQQGNALQTLLAMAPRAHRRAGRHRHRKPRRPASHHVRRSTRFRGSRASIIRRVDIRAATAERRSPCSGQSRWDEDSLVDLHNAAMDFSWVNPHVTLSFARPDDQFSPETATEPKLGEVEADRPDLPALVRSASLKNLIAAEINKARRERLRPTDRRRLRR